MGKDILYGKRAMTERRDRLNDLHLVVKGNRGWQTDFCIRYPHLDTIEGGKIFAAISRGSCDDAEFLRCFEDFIPFIQKTQPEWFKKQLKIEIPNNIITTTDGPEN